jgi:Type IV secretion system pilin
MMSLLKALLVSTAYAIPAGIDDSGCEFATGGPIGADGNTVPGGMWECIPEYIRNITFMVISLAASIALLLLIINGFRYMLGPALPDGTSDAAKKGILYSIVGLGVCLMAYLILDTIIVSVTS